MTPSVLELDSIVQSQIVLQEVKEPENSDAVMKDILEMISEPSGSKELKKELSIPKPRVGMSSRMVKISRP